MSWIRKGLNKRVTLLGGCAALIYALLTLEGLGLNDANVWQSISVQDLRSRMGAMEGTSIQLIGHVSSADQANAGKADRYLLNGYYGGTIMVQASGALPSSAEHVFIRGIVRIDATGEGVIVETQRRVLDEMSVATLLQYDLPVAVLAAGKSSLSSAIDGVGVLGRAHARGWESWTVRDLRARMGVMDGTLVQLIGQVSEINVQGVNKADSYVLRGYQGGTLRIQTTMDRPLPTSHVFIRGVASINALGEGFIFEAERHKLDELKVAPLLYSGPLHAVNSIAANPGKYNVATSH